MDKKIILGILLVSLLLIPLCTENKEKPVAESKGIASDVEAKTVTSESQSPVTTVAQAPLTELQTEACNNAEIGGTCESKLKELNIVPLEDCCKYLGKCCA